MNYKDSEEKMKIVDFFHFAYLPAGTLFSKYRPCCFESLCIKGETIFRGPGDPIDFFYQSINDSIDCNSSGDFIDKLVEAEEKGISLDMDFLTESRDGMFDYEQLYAVWETDDMRDFVDRLNIALKDQNTGESQGG